MSSTTSITFSTVNRHGVQAAYVVGKPVHLKIEDTTRENWTERFGARSDTSYDRQIDMGPEEILQFVITQTVSQPGDSTIVHHMFGYTDPVDNLELMSDRMKLHFSRAITIRSVQVRDITGIRTISKVIEDALLTQAWLDGCRTHRPGDIFTYMGSEAAFNAFLTPGMQSINMTGSFRPNQVKMLRTSNESPVRYIKTISDALHGALSEDDGDLMGLQEDQLYSSCVDRVSEPALMHHWFFNQLGRDTNFEQDGFVTFGDLKNVFELETISTNFTDTTPRQGLTPWTCSTESWLANLLIASVNAGMTDYGYMAVRLDGIIGKSLVHLSQFAAGMLDRNSFEDLIPEFDIKRPSFVDVVKRDLKTFMWNADLPPIQFSVHVDVAGVAKVDIKVGDEKHQCFERPMYMIGMLSGQASADDRTIEQTRSYFSDAIKMLTLKATTIEKGVM